jgi:hypothetical protein
MYEIIPIKSLNLLIYPNSKIKLNKNDKFTDATAISS